MQAILVEALNDGSLIRCETIKDSHPSPQFFDVKMRVVSLREGGDGLLAKLAISGTVCSKVCDLVAGDHEAIQTVTLRVNCESTKTIPTEVEKATAWHSLHQPYPMIAKFAIEIDDVVLSGGGNTIELCAKDPVPGFCLSGNIQLGINVGYDWATPKPEGNPTIHKVGEKNYFTWGPELVTQSLGGELHVYYVCFDSPSSAVDTGTPIVVGLGDGYYLAGRNGRPEPQVLVSSTASKSNVRPTGMATFEAGFLEGFVFSKAAFALGSLKLERNGKTNSLEVLLASQLAGLLGLVQTKVGSLGFQVANYSNAVRAIYEYVNAVNNRNYIVLLAAAAEEWGDFSTQSKELALFGIYVPELLECAHKDFGPRISPDRLGRFQGMICCETLYYIIAARKLGNTSKEKVLTKLRQSDVLGDEGPNLFDRVVGLWKSLPFG